MSTKPSFGNKVLASINERIEPAKSVNQPTPSPDLEEGPIWVSFTTAVSKETYMKLKQAEHWIPGFLMKELTESALVSELEKYPEADKPLPPLALEKLLRTSKKLR
ncbi:hypothetical protein [Hymenobacter terrestris]|uniref:Uncharacterized protein n=1 Tax=Hymenobacter terrestris TaxID=2748310 RepID=A0ABX2QAQ7_9BACT|nr:hypothetical protein [Hymenobacter terrestris]NVO86759.1 hypothetical protein [Hymenobacter terrestris]